MHALLLLTAKPSAYYAFIDDCQNIETNTHSNRKMNISDLCVRLRDNSAQINASWSKRRVKVHACDGHAAYLAQAAGLALRLHERQNVALADGALRHSEDRCSLSKTASTAMEMNARKRMYNRATCLDVADDGAASVVQKLNAHLDATTLCAGAAKHLGDLERGCECVRLRVSRRFIGLERRGLSDNAQHTSTCIKRR